MAAHQAPPSLGFSRQEHWSGLPFPSPAWKEKFIRGGMENGYTEEFLEKIWRDWMRRGNYLFNKSHAVCYTWLAYKTAYLKAHYPEEFMQAYFTINDKAI